MIEKLAMPEVQLECFEITSTRLTQVLMHVLQFLLGSILVIQTPLPSASRVYLFQLRKYNN